MRAFKTHNSIRWRWYSTAAVMVCYQLAENLQQFKAKSSAARDRAVLHANMGTKFIAQCFQNVRKFYIHFTIWSLAASPLVCLCIYYANSSENVNWKIKEMKERQKRKINYFLFILMCNNLKIS